MCALHNAVCYRNVLEWMKLRIHDELTPSSREARQQIPRILWNPKVTSFTRAHHLFVSWARPIEYMIFHPTSWRAILILSFHLRLDLPGGLFPSDLPTKTLYAPLPSPIHATCPVDPILLDLMTRVAFG